MKVTNGAWFSRVGFPLEPDERRHVAAILEAFDYRPDTPIDVAATWNDAAQVLRGQEWDNRWWDSEEEGRERLWDTASERLIESELSARLTAMTGSMADPIREGAGNGAARAGITDTGLIRAATDAASLAAHQQCMAHLAGAPAGHYFHHKFKLFAGGRWPFGVVDGRYIVF